MKKLLICLCTALSVCWVGISAFSLIGSASDGEKAGNSAEVGKYILFSGGLNGSTDVQVTRDYILDYMNRDYDSVTKGLLLSLMGMNGDICKPEEVPVTWHSRIYGQNVKYRVNLSLNEDFEEFITFDGEGDYPYQTVGGEGCIFVSNLCVGTKYYYRIEGEAEDGTKYLSETGSFTTEATPARWVNWGEISNSRDIGGWKTTGGYFVKQGLIYRSGRMQEPNGSPIISEDIQDYIIDSFGIKTDVDLRGMYDDTLNTTESLYGKMELVSAPIYAYADMFTNIATKNNLKKIFSTFADESKYPMYIHCSAGADRTGMVTFLLNGLLGVEYEDLIRDFELTSFSDQTMRHRSYDMESVYDTLMKYGKDKGAETVNQAIEVWLTEYIGVTAAEINAIREIMLENRI